MRYLCSLLTVIISMFLVHPCLAHEDCSNIGIAVTGDFLYWQPKVSGIPYASTNIIDTLAPGFNVANDIVYQSVEFDYEPGFRLGALYQLPCNLWDFEVVWTHFNCSGSDSIYAGNGQVISSFWENPTAITSTVASSIIDLKTEIVDLNIGRLLNLCGCLRLRPFIGFRLYQLDIKDSIAYVGVSSIPPPMDFPGRSDVTLVSNNKGYGLNVGANIKWRFLGVLNLSASGSYSLLNTKSCLANNQHTQVPDLDLDAYLNLKNKFWSFRQSLRALIGFDWDYYFVVSRLPVTLNIFAGYEINYWPNFIEVNRAQSPGVDNALIAIQSQGDVGFHGLTTGVHIRF